METLQGSSGSEDVTLKSAQQINIDFSTALRSRNRDVNRSKLTKEEVTQQYTLAVLQEYSTADSERFELLGEVHFHPGCISHAVRDRSTTRRWKTLSTTTPG